ncbi:sigma-70 family RNA polymerase sigma factor [Camelliibacillus cellulosilyticus]|uniref:Sigma-70 family RNA polymerase sigma factor n=1 Tax=Camelliibacillus cellulosilyticus TaxID=2174486 RepID=A0ABV9GKF0_9BACL
MKTKAKKKTRSDRRFLEVERLLRHYRYYKSGIVNLKRQLDYIMPGCVANYDIVEGSTGTFSIRSTTEKYAIDRIESKRALDLHEKIKKYELIVKCIDDSLKGLTEEERRFVEIRYFDNKPIRYAADVLGYSERSIFNLRRDVLDKLKISLSGVINL